MYTITAYNSSSFDVDGPDPFLDQETRNDEAFGRTVITLKKDAVAATVHVSDDDPEFHDPKYEYKGPQTLAKDASLAGSDFSAGATIAAEYSYDIWPKGSSDRTDVIRITVFRINGNIVGVTSNRVLEPGASYIVSRRGEDHPSPFYSELAPVCFTPGTLIDTPSGARPVEELCIGDRVLTLDNGVRTILWAGGRRSSGLGKTAPVVVCAGRLGNRRDLVLSPNHRVLVGQGGAEGVVAVKALVDGRSVVSSPRPVVTYLHLLLDGHHLVRAAGAPVESLWPGPQAVAALAPAQRAAVLAVVSAAGGVDTWSSCRPFIRPGIFRRSSGLSERHG